MSGLDVGQQPEPPKLGDIVSGIKQRSQQHEQASGEFTGRLFKAIADRDNQRAQTIGEHVGWQLLAGAKAVGDGVTNLFGLAFKAGAGAASTVSGEGFRSGYEAAGQQMESTFGSANPSILDVMQAIDPTDPGGIQMGEAADRMIDERLGRKAVIGQTVGHIASFMTGPSAAVGNVVGKASGPLSRFGQRVFAKAIVGEQAADQMLRQGRVWSWIAGTPKWKQTLARVGGRWLEESVDTGARMAAQAYGLAPDDERWDSMKAMALMAPLMVPIARLGQMTADRLAAVGMNGQQISAVRTAISDMEAGKIGFQQFSDVVAVNTAGLPRMAGQYIVAPALESVAFMGLDENARALLPKAWGGDTDAMAELAAIWAGTAGGIAVTKHGLPVDGIPMLKRLRPDLNNLSLYAESKATQGVKVTQKDIEMAADVAPTAEGIATMDGQPIDLSVSRFIRQPPEKAAFEKKLNEAITALDIAWAEVPADAAIKSGWEPSFPNSGVVELNHGNGFTMRIKRTPDGVDLIMSPNVQQALRDFGVDVADTHLGGPKAIEALGKVPMLSTLRNIQGSLIYEQMGFREVQPGVYMDPESGLLHTMQLDGKTATRSPLEDSWTGTKDIASVGTSGEPVWTNDTVYSMSYYLAQKQAIAPDPMTDSILANVLRVAQEGRGPAADELRAYLESTTFEQILGELKPATDAQLALRLGSLASGFNNAQYASMKAAEAVVRPEGPKTKEQLAENLEGTLAEFSQGAVDKPLSPESGMAGVEYTPEEAAAIQEQKQAGKRQRKMSVRAVKDYLFRAPAEILEREVPNSEYVRKARETIAEAGAISGEAGKGVRTARKAAGSGEGRRFLRETIRGDKAEELAKIGIKGASADAEYRIARLAMDRRVAASSPDMPQKARDIREAIVEGAQQALKTTYRANQEAGTLQMKEGKMVPLRDIERAVLPFREGKGVEPVMKQEWLRKAYFKELANVHKRMIPDVDPETGRQRMRNTGKGKREPVMRRETAEDIEARYQAQIEQQLASGVTVENVDVKQAVEFAREYPNRPDTFMGYEMIDPNVIKTLDETVAKQAHGAATHKILGQDVPNRPAVIKDLKAQLEALPPEAPERAGIERSLNMLQSRPGVKQATTAFKGEIKAALEAKGDIGELDRLSDLTDRWIERVQAGEPEKLGPVLRALARYARYASPIMTVKSGLYDIPDMAVRGSIYFGGKETFKSIAEVARNPAEAIRYYEDIGVINRVAGDLAVEEAVSLPQKIADVASIPSMFLERLKGAINAKLADRVIARLKDGTAQEGWYDVLRGEIRLDESTMAEIRSQKISDLTEKRLRREIVNLLGSRVTSAETSEFGASPKLTPLIPFRKFFTARIPKILDTYASMARAKDKAEFGRSAFRALKLTTGLAVGGVAARWLAMSLSEFFKTGDPTEGTRQMADRLTNGWDGFLATMGTESLNQVFGGPFSSAAEVVRSPESGRSVANLTHPTRLGWALVSGAHALAEGDVWRAWNHLAADTGVVPMARDAGNLWRMTAARLAGENMQIRRDAALVRGWMRDNGINRSFSERTREPEFYDAVDSIVAIASRDDLSTAEKLTKAKDALRTALDLAPESSLAASIEGHQIMRYLKQEQRDQLLKDTRDEDLLRRLFQHDQMLKAVAREVRKMEGTPDGDWEQMLELTSKHAALGGADKWDDLVDRAVSDTVDSLMSGEGYGTKLEDVANAMAAFPGQLGQVLSEKDLARLERMDDSSSRSRRIYAILRKRVTASAKEKRREARREAPK